MYARGWRVRSVRGWSVNSLRVWSVRSAGGEVYDLPGGGL